MPLARCRPLARNAATGAQLHAGGALTDEEFATAEAEALGI